MRSRQRVYPNCSRKRKTESVVKTKKTWSSKQHEVLIQNCFELLELLKFPISTRGWKILHKEITNIGEFIIELLEKIKTLQHPLKIAYHNLMLKKGFIDSDTLYKSSTDSLHVKEKQNLTTSQSICIHYSNICSSSKELESIRLTNRRRKPENTHYSRSKFKKKSWNTISENDRRSLRCVHI